MGGAAINVGIHGVSDIYSFIYINFFNNNCHRLRPNRLHRQPRHIHLHSPFSHSPPSTSPRYPLQLHRSLPRPRVRPNYKRLLHPLKYTPLTTTQASFHLQRYNPTFTCNRDNPLVRLFPNSRFTIPLISSDSRIRSSRVSCFYNPHRPFHRNFNPNLFP